MHTRYGYVLKHRLGGVYLDKSMSGHTASLYAAITFRSKEEAEHMLTNSHFKPKNADDYYPQRTIEQRLETEEEKNDDSQSGTEKSKITPRD